MTNSPTLIPIYTTRGDCTAYLSYPYLFNQQGDWIGFVTSERQVFSVYGMHVGWLSSDRRILRKKGEGSTLPRRSPPPPPRRFRPPAQVPLAPMMAELSFDTLDVLLEDPERLPTEDVGEFRSDLD